MKIKVVFFFLIILLTATGCSGTTDQNQARERNLSKHADEIVIGVAWPFAEKNDGFKEGLELALEEINDSGVLGKKVRLIVEDDQSSVTTGLSIAQSFANNMDLSAVIGHRSSVVTVPASKVYESAGLLLVAPISTAPNLTGDDMSRVFRMIPSDVQIGNRMAEYAKLKNYKNMVIFYANDEYGRGLANSFEDYASANGIQIVDRISDYKDANDLKRLVDKWSLLNYDAIFLAESMPNGADMITQLRKVGMDVPIIGGDALDAVGLIDNSGQAADGIVVASIFNPNDSRKEVTDFIEKYRSKYGTEPSKWAAQAYDSLKLLAFSIDHAGTSLPADVALAIKQLESWSGVSGVRAFNSHGDPQEMPIVLKEVRNGKFEYLK